MTFTEQSAATDTRSTRSGQRPSAKTSGNAGRSKPSSSSNTRQKARVDRTMGPNSWQPRKSSPFKEHTLHLSSLVAQQLLQSTYGRTQVALYNVRFMAPMLADQKVARELATTVNAMLGNIREELDETIGQMRVVRQQKGAGEVVKFSDPEVHVLQWFTPATHQFILVIEQFDELMAEIETLWMVEHFDDDEKKSLAFEWRTRLIRFARQLIDLQVRSLEAVRRKTNKGDQPRKPKAASENGRSTEPATPVEPGAVAGEHKAGGADKDAESTTTRVAHASDANVGVASNVAAESADALIDAALADVSAVVAPAPAAEPERDIGAVLLENIAEKQDLDDVVSESSGVGVIRRTNRRAVSPVPPADADVIKLAALG